MQDFYAGSPGGRLQEANSPGSVPNSPVGQQEPNRFGINSLLGTGPAIGRWIEKNLMNIGEGTGRFFSGQQQVPFGQRAGDRSYSQGQATGAGGSKTKAGSGKVFNAPGQGPTQPTWEEWAAANGFGGGGGGGGASRPDFSAYRQALTDQAGGINAQIQAMYNQLGEQAGANVSRLEDIYSGAGEGINAGYDAATSNIQQAFGSAQQQAADQMARLGIEDAAGQVLPSQALAQAQAISSLEQGRGSGLSASERFGSSAGGFASQMAQTAQQQGTEMNSAILASLQNRLAESLAAEQSGGGGGGGGGGMSVSDQLRLREAYNQEVGGQLPLDERKFAFDVAQASAGNANDLSQWKRDTFLQLTLPQGGQKPLYTPEEATAYLNAVQSSIG